MMLMSLARIEPGGKVAAKRQVLPPEERKEELLQAASAVISEKGYRNASISDIIERAGVARGTFYHYFDSKKDIFLELIEKYFADFAEILEQNHTRLFSTLEDSLDLPGAWRENALAILRFHSDNPELTALVYREAMGLDENFTSRVQELSRFARNRMVEEFQMLADRGLLVPCDVEIVTTIVNGAMINMIMEYILQERDCDLADLADALVKNQLRALTPR
jgi:AcrR family transcriptional regulator